MLCVFQSLTMQLVCLAIFLTDNFFCAIELRSNYPSSLNLVSQRWGNVTGCSVGGGFRALVGARHAVPLCGEGVWVGRGVVFFEGGSGMNDGYPAGDDNLYGG
jgi:hypothetical protein